MHVMLYNLLQLIATAVLHFLMLELFVKQKWLFCAAHVPRLVETHLWLVNLYQVLAIWLLSSKVKFEPWYIMCFNIVFLKGIWVRKTNDDLYSYQ